MSFIHDLKLRVVSTSTFMLEGYLILQMAIWVLWLVVVQKEGATLPFWNALNVGGGATKWAVGATLITCTMCAGMAAKELRRVRIAALAAGSIYLSYLSIVMYHSVPTALAPWWAALSACACLYSLLHALATK